MKLSNHAIARSNQRGIPQFIVPIIMEYGTENNKPGGVIELVLTKKNRYELIGRLKNVIKVIEKTNNKAILVDSNFDDVITMYIKK